MANDLSAAPPIELKCIRVYVREKDGISLTSFFAPVWAYSIKMTDKFEALEQQLEMFIENTRQIGIIVSDMQPQGQSVLNQKL